MRKIFCLFLSSAAIAARAMVPEVGYQPYYLAVDSIDSTPQATRLSLTLSNYPGFWVKIDSTSVLTDDATGQTYKIIGQENLPLSQEIWMPASGTHSGTLIFEPVPASATSLSYGSPDDGVKDHILGIRLDQPRKPCVEQNGESALDVLSWPAPAEKWEGFDAAKYADMAYYKPGTTALLRGRVANVYPGFTATVETDNYLFRKDDKTLVEFDSLGNFSVEVPVDYPQLSGMRLGRNFVWFMLVPGDTCELYTTTLCKFDPVRGDFVPEYTRIGGNNPDAVAIACLRDDVRRRFVDPRADYQWWIKKVNAGYDSVMEAAAGIKADMPAILARAQAGIAEYPISPYAKDFLYTYAAVKNYMPLADMHMYWTDNETIRSQDENGRTVVSPNPDYVPLDIKEYYGGMQAFQDLIYDNPLVLCIDYIIINRGQFSPIFRWQDLAVNGLKTLPEFGSDLDEMHFGGDVPASPLIKRYEQQRLQAIGLGDCWMQQFILAHGLCSTFTVINNYSEYVLNDSARLLADVLPLISCRALSAEAIASYGKYAKNYGRTLAQTGSQALVLDLESDILQTIVAPYAGRVVYVDVWDITCGPCRAGIMAQKPLLQQYADQPLTVIYLAPESSKDRCEDWLRDNGVKGEHVYLTDDSMNRLRANFNINGIPHAILVDKQGRVVKNDAHLLTPELIDPLLK